MTKLEKNMKDIDMLLSYLSELGQMLLAHSKKEGVSAKVAQRCFLRYLRFLELDHTVRRKATCLS